MRTRGLALAGVAVLAVLGILFLVVPAGSPGPAPVSGVDGRCTVVATDVPGAAASGLPVRPLCALPAEAAQVWAQITAGGPLRYERDGLTFGNRERLLPARGGGFYREYTVPTPGERDRGARRLVTGGDRGPGQELYYTGDHYASFVVVDATAGR